MRPFLSALHPRRTSLMTAEDPRVDLIVDELLEKTLSKDERVELLRELVKRGEELSDEMLAGALRRLMDRLTE